MAGYKLSGRSSPQSTADQSGGLNSTSSPLNVKDNEATDLQNIDFSKFGSIVKRSGYTVLNSTPFNSGAAFVGLHWYQKSDLTRYLFGVAGNKIGRMAELTGTWSDITGAVTITAGNSNLISSVTFLDTALFTNDVDPPFQATDSGNAVAMAVPAGVTKAKFIELYNAYVFIANVEDGGGRQPTKLYWSDINSITSWTATNLNYINRNDGQAITGLKTLGDKLIIFKERSIWIASFTGDADVPFVFQQTPSSVGAISGYSIQEFNNGLIFLAYDGIYYFDGLNSEKLSDKINVTIQGLNQNSLTTAISMYQHTKNRYWLSIQSNGVSTNDTIITLDTFNNAFSVYKGIAANAMTIIYTSNQERPYFGDYAGYTYRADTGTDDYPLNVQTAIDAYYYGKWLNFGDLMDVKGIPHIIIYYQINSSTLSFSYSYDFADGAQYTQSISMSSSGALFDTAIWDTDIFSSQGGALSRVDLIGRGRVVRFKLANSTLSETFTIDGFGMMPGIDTYK